MRSPSTPNTSPFEYGNLRYRWVWAFITHTAARRVCQAIAQKFLDFERLIDLDFPATLLAKFGKLSLHKKLILFIYLNLFLKL